MHFELWYTSDRWLQTFHMLYIQYYNNSDTQKNYLITYEYILINYNA